MTPLRENLYLFMDIEPLIFPITSFNVLIQQTFIENVLFLGTARECLQRTILFDYCSQTLC